MKPVILLRHSLADEEEIEAAKKYFKVIERRTQVEKGDLLIPRYSALPYNEELCLDLKDLGAEPINTYRQHCYAADLRNWYYDLGDYTPRTWFALDQIPKDGGPFFLKGQVNSIKRLWNTHAYAETYLDAVRVYTNLASDGYVGAQQIYIRQFVPLERLATGLNGLPISREYRHFVLDGKVIAAGFYWSTHAEDLEEKFNPSEVPQDFVQKIIAAVGNQIRFWVFDVAKTADGDWILVELNDGQQSGLSMIDPNVLYSALASNLR